MISTAMLLVSLSAPPTVTPAPPTFATSANWPGICPEARAGQIVHGTTKQALGGGFVASGILGVLGSTIGLIGYSDSNAKPLIVSLGASAGIIAIGAIAIASGRDMQGEALLFVCPKAADTPAPPPAPRDNVTPPPGIAEPPPYPDSGQPTEPK